MVTSADLESIVRRCFERVGLPAADAATVAEILLDANLRGHDSHGIARAPAYMRRVAAGVAGGSERLSAPAGSGPLRRMDAGSALGPIAARIAAGHAAGLAREHGIGLVAIGNSSHFGAAGFYARELAAQGLMALVTTNGPANMAPHGGAEPFLGTNGFAIGIPLFDRELFVLDMSCSVVARGKIMRAHGLGEPIEPGLAIDSDGNPTVDAAAALAGAVLPLGGAKGAGLALAISLAGGILAGASFDDEAGRMHGSDARPQDLGQIVLAIDPWRLADRGEIERRIEGLIDRLHSLRPAAGVERVLYPGERGDAERRARLDAGVPVAGSELEEIARACIELGYSDLAESARSLRSEAKP